MLIFLLYLSSYFAFYSSANKTRNGKNKSKNTRRNVCIVCTLRISYVEREVHSKTTCSFVNKNTDIAVLFDVRLRWHNRYTYFCKAVLLYYCSSFVAMMEDLLFRDLSSYFDRIAVIFFKKDLVTVVQHRV